MPLQYGKLYSESRIFEQRLCNGQKITAVIKQVVQMPEKPVAGLYLCRFLRNCVKQDKEGLRFFASVGRVALIFEQT